MLYRKPKSDLDALADKVVDLALPKLLKRYAHEEAITVIEGLLDSRYNDCLVYISEIDALILRGFIDDIKRDSLQEKQDATD